MLGIGRGEAIEVVLAAGAVRGEDERRVAGPRHVPIAIGVLGEACGAGLVGFILHEEELPAQHEGNLLPIRRYRVVAQAIGHLHLLGRAEPVVGRHGGIEHARFAAVLDHVHVGLPFESDDAPIAAGAEGAGAVLLIRGDGFRLALGGALVGNRLAMDVVGAALLANVEEGARARPHRAVIVPFVRRDAGVRVVLGVVYPHVAVGRPLVALLAAVVVASLDGDEPTVGRHTGGIADRVQAPVGRTALGRHLVNLAAPLGLYVGTLGCKEERSLRRPPAQRIAGGMVREALRRATVGPHHVNVVVPVAIARERDLGAVGAPAGVSLVGLVDGEALGPPPGHRHGPEVPLIRERHPVAVRVHGRMAHERIGVLCHRRQRKQRQENTERQKAANHSRQDVVSRERTPSIPSLPSWVAWIGPIPIHPCSSFSRRLRAYAKSPCESIREYRRAISTCTPMRVRVNVETERSRTGVGEDGFMAQRRLLVRDLVCASTRTVPRVESRQGRDRIGCSTLTVGTTRRPKPPTRAQSPQLPLNRPLRRPVR